MELVVGFILSFAVLLYGVLKGIYIGYALSISLTIFSIISLRRGTKPGELMNIAWSGGKKALVVLKIFLLIGLVTASWLAAGTIQSIVYYSMQIMNPRFFVVFAFLASSLVAYMLGTSFGTASTIGIVLMVMARSGNINLNMAAGAIIAGAYFGDRTSPMSSCANLVANLTETELYPMLKGFRKTTIIPFIAVTIIYLFLSFSNPLTTEGSNILTHINDNFVVNFIVLLPAIIMLVLSSFQFNVRKSMVLSIILGIVISLTIQKIPLSELIRHLVFGYKLEPDNPLVDILKGGGLFAMAKASFVVFISCSMAGVLEGLDMFSKINNLLTKVHNRSKVFLATAITSIFSAAFGGNQSIAVVMTSQIMKSTYERLEIEKYELATDISNTAVLFAPMIPWNIANLIPATTLDVSPVGFVPYCYYLYISFIINYMILKLRPKDSYRNA